MPQLGPGLGDGPLGTDDFGREQVTGIGSNRYQFRTPMLLNVELTAPYGHAGQYSTLVSQVNHYWNPTDRLNDYAQCKNPAAPENTAKCGWVQITLSSRRPQTRNAGRAAWHFRRTARLCLADEGNARSAWDRA